MSNQYALGVCDWCKNYDGPCVIQPDNSKACPKCNYDLVLRAQVDAQPEEELKPINPDSVLQTGKDVLANIQTGNDVFSAPTVELQKVKDEIFASDEENKNFKYTEYVAHHFLKLKAVVYNKQIEQRKLAGEISELNKQQVEIQSHLNKLANTLRIEEREKLQLTNVTYNPKKVKEFSPRPPKEKRVKVAMADLIYQAQRLTEILGKPVKVETIEGMCISRNYDAEQAANYILQIVKLQAEKNLHAEIDKQESESEIDAKEKEEEKK